MRKKVETVSAFLKKKEEEMEEKQLNADIKCACVLKWYLQMALWR